jgi:ribosomal protein S27AE
VTRAPEAVPTSVQCPSCGAGEWRLVERVGLTERFLCARCGFEQWSSVSPSPPSRPLSLVRVVVRWASGTPSPVEVVAVRQLAPRLNGLPASELLRVLRERPEYELGSFYPGKAEELLARGAELGLSMERR